MRCREQLWRAGNVDRGEVFGDHWRKRVRAELGIVDPERLDRRNEQSMAADIPKAGMIKNMCESAKSNVKRAAGDICTWASTGRPHRRV